MRSQDRFANAVGFAGESVDAIETVQAFGRVESAVARFGAVVEEAFGVSLIADAGAGLMTAMVIVVIFGGVTLVLWLGAQDVIAGRDDAGRPAAVRAAVGVHGRGGRRARRKLGRRAEGRRAPWSGSTS